MRLGFFDARLQSGPPACGGRFSRPEGSRESSSREPWDRAVQSERWGHRDHRDHRVHDGWAGPVSAVGGENVRRLSPKARDGVQTTPAVSGEDGRTCRWVSGLACALCVVLASVGVASAQISPGPLSRPHSKLEGSGKCLSCHDPKQGVSPSKCFACHQPLEARVKSWQGTPCASRSRGLQALPRGAPGGRRSSSSSGGRRESLPSITRRRATLSPAAMPVSRATVATRRHRSSEPSPTALPVTRTRIGASSRSAPAPRATRRRPGNRRPGFDHGKTTWPLTGRHTSVGCDKCHVPRQVKAGEPQLPTAHSERWREGSARAATRMPTRAGWGGTAPSAIPPPAGGVHCPLPSTTAAPPIP